MNEELGMMNEELHAPEAERIFRFSFVAEG